MEITSLSFLVLIGIMIIVYYAIREEKKWIVLLTASLFFICTYDIRGLVFIFTTSFSIWIGGKKIYALAQEKSDDTEICKKKQKQILHVILIVNLITLILLKYVFPKIPGCVKIDGPFRLLIPLGLSYYTLQAISYIMDVYWERIEAEKSFWRVHLFICYFPQMIQGPISRYANLGKALKESHPFQIKNLKYGIQLMLWGYFQVMVVGKRMGEMVDKIFHNGETAYGLSVLMGLVLFGIQLYCNFNGGINIIQGVSECFDIHLTDNFRQPFFSVSLGDFWRRWHITLGSWMKEYVFFPFSMSRPITKLKKKLKKKVPRRFANRVPIALANIVVFLIVGIWHGTGTNYAIWGLYNGLLLAGAELLTDFFQDTKKRLCIQDSNKAWTIFCWLRTFMIVTIGWCTDCADTAAGSILILKNMLMLHASNPGIAWCGNVHFLISIFGVGVIIAVDMMHEKGISIRDQLNGKHYWIQVIFWALLIQMIACLRSTTSVGGFMYANF